MQQYAKENPKGKSNMPKYTGYIIARKLYDEKGKLKPYSYYPRKKGGVPPYHYKTKAQAERIRKTKRSEFGSRDLKFNPKETKVVKFTKKTYLDRF